MVTFKRLQISQEDDFTTVFLLYYLCFTNHDKMIAIDLGKQQELDADQKQHKKLIFLEICIAQEMQQCFYLWRTGRKGTVRVL